MTKQKIEKKLIPNSFQTPNAISDLLIPRIPEAEARCIIYICRRTFGFHKTEDRISLTQFMYGIKTKDGRRLDYGAGLARSSVCEAIKNLVNSKAIFVEESTLGNIYKLNTNMDIDGVVRLIDQYRKRTASSPVNRPKVVRLPNLQYKEKQRETKNSVFKKNTIEILTDYYYELKDWNDQPKSFYKEHKISYPRNCKASKDVLLVCNNDLKKAKERVDKIKAWADKNKIDWSLETIIKRFYHND